MQPDAIAEFIAKKAYTICYVVFRLASAVKSEALMSRIEDAALGIVAFAASHDYSGLERQSLLLERLLRIGSDLNLIDHKNSEVIVSELVSMNSAIAELSLPRNLPDFNAKKEFEVAASSYEGRLGLHQKARKPAVSKGTVEVSHSDDDLSGNAAKMEMRQSAIVEKIRQNVSCRLKDLQEFFPDVSERTLRYDLQGLTAHGLIERVGSGGPSTYYQVKAASPPMVME